jgi:hypothetical protein
MSDEPEHGTKVTNDSKEAADKVSEHASKLANAISNGNAGDAVKYAAKVVGYGAQVAGHLSAGN